MSTGSAERPVAKPQGTAHRVRVIIFRVLATIAGLFFVVAVVLMASAPWVLLQPDQDVRTELRPGQPSALPPQAYGICAALPALPFTAYGLCFSANGCKRLPARSRALRARPD
jgi:hypothetical protein